MGFPWVANDLAPTPTAAPIINGGWGRTSAGFGGYAMWNNHLYADATLYRSASTLASPQPNAGTDFAYNIRGLAPYWRVAWQQLTGKTQYEVGTYGMHMRSSPGAITKPTGSSWRIRTRIGQLTLRSIGHCSERTCFRSGPRTSAKIPTCGELRPAMRLRPAAHHLNTVLANAEYHIGNKYSGTFGWFNTSGTPTRLSIRKSR